ncbi:prepilin peptidase [Cytobacillus sp. FJAT-54145]|uniref:Prepilin peptidase n=1 Tax=Cytobacillus spartinae TaxID=3299023 RepID=A0ABW6K9K8_9BACI
MIFDSLLILVLLICLITDIKSRKIYNKVIFPALIVAIILHAFAPFGSGILFSLTGFGVGLALLLIPYLMGGMGAGDVKLLALVGALKGAMFVMTTGIYMAIIGALIALFVIMFRKGALRRLKSIVYTVSSYKHGIKIPLALDKDALQTTYPYGVAIAGGAFMSLLAKGWLIL